MKKTCILFCAVILPLAVRSQDHLSQSITSGKISFLEKRKLEIKLEGDAAQFADQIPKEQMADKILYFNTDYSLYTAGAKKATDEDINMNQHEGGIQIRMFNGGDNDIIFCDIKDGKKTEQKEFMTRKFLVDGDLISSDWKLTGNFRMISGYNCQEAVKQVTSKKVNAWFTTLIPVSSGPSGFGGLPGMILQVDINNGKQVITATAIDPSLTDPSVLTKPKDGKRVTAEEFRKIVEEKRKEMGVEDGQGTNHVVIKIRN
jgi:GLPGLI family protein